MDGIIQFLKTIGDAIVAAFDFLVDLIADLIYVIQLLGKVVLQLPGFFSWLPGEAVSLLLILFSIVIIYKILGREG